MTNHSVTNHSVTNHSVTNHSVTNHSVTNHGVTIEDVRGWRALVTAQLADEAETLKHGCPLGDHSDGALRRLLGVDYAGNVVSAVRIAHPANGGHALRAHS
jgi:hypothetical protein